MSSEQLALVLEPANEPLQLTERLTCDTAGQHIPGCHNPQPAHLWRGAPGVTACVCGARWWPGQVGTWHSSRHARVIGESAAGRPIYAPDGPWLTYFLHAHGCPGDDGTYNPGYDHRCVDVADASGAEAWCTTTTDTEETRSTGGGQPPPVPADSGSVASSATAATQPVPAPPKDVVTQIEEIR